MSDIPHAILGAAEAPAHGELRVRVHQTAEELPLRGGALQSVNAPHLMLCHCPSTLRDLQASAGFVLGRGSANRTREIEHGVHQAQLARRFVIARSLSTLVSRPEPPRRVADKPVMMDSH